MKKFFNRPYSLLKFRIFLWQFCLLGPIIMFVYILAIKPFGISMFESSEQIRLAIFYSFPPMLIWMLNMFLLKPILIKHLTILNTIVFLIWINLLMGLYNYTFAEIYIFGSQFDFYWLSRVLYRTMGLGVVVATIVAFIHAGWLMRRKNIKKKKYWMPE